MKAIQVLLAALLLVASTAPAQADFKYTETSQVTGGALISMAKLASVFALGGTKKQEQQALQPTSTTHYLKGGRLRTDRQDGTAQIIDLDGRRVIMIDLNKKTYAVATFDQMQAAMAQLQQRVQQNSQPNQQTQNPQVKITPTVHVTSGTGSRVILDQPTNETKVEMDMAMQGTTQANGAGPNAPPAGQPNSGSVTWSMNMDTFVAPGVAGYQEFAQFYRRMAQEVNWMKLPAMNMQVDPRVAQGMSELQQNSDALKGFPLLSYVSMTMAATDNGQPLPAGAQTGGSSQQNQQPTTPAPANSGGASNSTIPTNPSAAVIKGLGGLFGKKKQQQDNSSASSAPSNPDAAGAGGAGTAGAAGAPPANPNSNPNALMEITTQVTAFSESSLDGSLFDIPAGYTQVQEDPAQIFGGRAAPQQPSR